MIPIRDNIPSRTTPYVNYAVIAACVLVFFAQGSNPQLTEQLAMIPARLLGGEQVLIPDLVPRETLRGVVLQRIERPVLPALVPDLLTLLTCVFLHGGWLHLIGNMWSLWIFGDNVEDRFGHGGFVAFYLGGGLAASLAHLLTNLDSPLPTVGASGAIAAVMGAYFVLYPRAQILTVIPFFIFYMVVLPAPFFLGFWFLLQILQGSASSLAATDGGGVAWWAHAGGFVYGVGIALVLKNRRLKPPVQIRRPNADQSGVYRINLRRPQR